MADRPTASPPVIVVGGGIAGVACARALADAGRSVRLLERAHRLGGRLAVRTESVAGPGGELRHPVDLGAPYFTVREPGFAAVVARWQRSGLAREWTDRFSTAGPDGITGVSAGPVRWSSTAGLRALVEALAEGLDVHLEKSVGQVESDGDRLLVDGEPATAVVLAMPDPQAARLVSAELGAGLGVLDREWSPVLSVWAAWPERCWPEFDGIFVADSPVLSWLADSGRSRGDGAPVLVAHSCPEFAEQHLADPPAALEPMLLAVSDLLGGLSAPLWSRVHRWSLASARVPHAQPFTLNDQLIGVSGDGWGPRSRVEQGWTSGTGLAERLLRRLAVS